MEAARSDLRPSGENEIEGKVYQAILPACLIVYGSEIKITRGDSFLGQVETI